MGKNCKLKKWFSKENLLILVLGGVLLFVISLPVEEKKDAGERGESKAAVDGGVESNVPVEGYADENEAYVGRLEQRLTDILSKMADVGKVQVLITLKSSEELIVEKEQPVNRSATNESDSQGGSRVVNEMSSEENTVYRSDGSISEPYVVKTLTPEIEGVLVVAQGAGSGTVNRTIVEIVQALFGVEAHKIKVVKMENDG